MTSQYPGSGTGEEILNLSKLNPQWQFTGVDPSADMMAVAQTRITEQGTRATLWSNDNLYS